MKNHVRVLLCTLPDVLWQGSGQARIGMDALMDPQKVRFAYRKYVQKFHPDKFESSKDYDKIYITTTVFAAINE